MPQTKSKPTLQAIRKPLLISTPTTSSSNTPTNFSRTSKNTTFRIRKTQTESKIRSLQYLDTDSNSSQSHTLQTLPETPRVLPRLFGSEPVRAKHSPKTFVGIWDQYQDIWFDIQCSLLEPLFFHIEDPKSIKTTLYLRETTFKRNGPLSAPKALGTPKKAFQIRRVISKVKQIEDDLLTCENCFQKKRKGMHLECRHYFCKDCVRGHISRHVEQLKFPVKCLKENCEYCLKQSELLTGAPSSESLVKLFDAMIADNIRRRPDQFVLCFTENCKFLFDLKKQKSKHSIRCPRCQKNYCLACHGIIKKNHHCEDANSLKGTIKG